MSNLRFSLAVVLTVMTGAAWAADQPFVGDWKLDPSKTTLTDVMKVASVGGNRYTFDVGGGPETVAADGTDQPGFGGTTVAVTLSGPDCLKFVRKKDGRMLLTANWTLSKDGSTLNDDFTSFSPDGSASNVKLVFQRTVGTSGFIGIWEGESSTVNFTYELKIQSHDGGGLTFTYPSLGVTRDLNFDGKDYPKTGANVIPGSTYSDRRVSERALEITDKIDGKVVDTQEIALSADLKTLMLTMHKTGVRSPNILVFERQ